MTPGLHMAVTPDPDDPWALLTQICHCDIGQDHNEHGQPIDPWPDDQPPEPA